MELVDFLPLFAVVVFAIIIYATMELFTCCLFPGTTGWAQKCGAMCGMKPTIRKRSRFLSIYEIYNPADTRRFEKMFTIAKARASADATKIEEGQEVGEAPEMDLPPSYDQAVVRVLDEEKPTHPNSVIV